MSDKPMVAWMTKAQFEKMGGALEDNQMSEAPKEPRTENYPVPPDVVVNPRHINIGGVDYMRVKPCPDCSNYQRGDPPCDWCKGIGWVIK